MTAAPGAAFAQAGYRCRLDWGRHGTAQAAARGDILVVVDTLRFSSAVATAVAHGTAIYPCALTDDAAALARQLDAVPAAAPGRFSLSPLSYLDAPPGTRVVLPSPNGATCSRYGAAVPYLFAGAPLNARAVAAAVAGVLAATDRAVTVIACGERWPAPTEDGPLRFAVEDYLGAGAILAGLPGSLSPEAEVCACAFRAAAPTLPALLWDCGSGRELRAKGHGDDVAHAARLDLYTAVPILRAGCFQPFS